MSYILDALKQNSDQKVSNQPVSFTHVPPESAGSSKELTGLVLQLLISSLLAVIISYGLYKLTTKPIVTIQTTHSVNQPQWPLIDVSVKENHFEQPLAALAKDQPQSDDQHYGVVNNQQVVQTTEPEVLVSNELREQFAAAVAESENAGAPIDVNELAGSDQVPHLSELPYSLQDSIPSMKFTSHMYSSNKNDRWIEVNNKKLLEGQWIASNVRLILIKPQHVVLQTDNYKYSLPALSEW